MIDDPIVAEVRRLRQEHAERFGYDIDRIFDDLKRSEQKRDRSNSPLLSPGERKPSPARVRFRQRGDLAAEG